MAEVLVLYHSMYGHIERMAEAQAEGARAVAGIEATVKRVPETMPEAAFRAAGGKVDQTAPVATPLELANDDAIVFGVDALRPALQRAAPDDRSEAVRLRRRSEAPMKSRSVVVSLSGEPTFPRRQPHSL